jgi:hypothetical protein
MKQIKTKRSFLIWVKQLDKAALDQQQKQFENQPVPPQFSQSWELGFPQGNTITYYVVDDKITAKYDLTGEEVDVTNFEELDVDFSFIPENQSKIVQWFNNINSNFINTKTAELVAQTQRGQISKGMQVAAIGEIKTGLSNSKLIWSSTPTGVGDIIKAKHSYTNDEYDLTDYEDF